MKKLFLPLLLLCFFTNFFNKGIAQNCASANSTKICYFSDNNSSGTNTDNQTVTVGQTWIKVWQFRNAGSSCTALNSTCTASNYYLTINTITKDGVTVNTSYLGSITSYDFTIGPNQIGYGQVSNTFNQPGNYNITFDIHYTDGTTINPFGGGVSASVTVTAASCTGWYTSPSSANYTATGGNGSFTAYASGGCGFYVVSQNGTWLAATAGTPVTYTVAANSGTSRTGYIWVYDANNVHQSTFTVNQDGASTCTTPNTPTLNTPTIVSSSQINLSWSNSSASNYTVYCSSVGCYSGSSSTITTSSTTTSITGLTAGTTYYFWVTANNSSCYSGNSSCQSATTLPGCTTNPPTANAASSITGNSFQANWGSVSGATGYYIDVATDVGFTNIVSGYNNYSTGNTYLNIFGLICNTSYYYRVRANGSCGTSGNSSSMSASTSACGSMSVSSFVIPPWQRQGDEFQGSITTSTTNPTGASWHLEVDVFANGVYETAIIYPSINTSTQNFYSTDPELASYSIAGEQFVFFAVLDASNSPTQVGSMDIIEKQWVNKNVVYYNDNNTHMKIPLKNISNCTSYSTDFYRVASTEEQLSFLPINNLNSIPQTSISGIDGYIHLSPSNSIIHTLLPGRFKYLTTYYSGSIILTSEAGFFELTKIGQLSPNNYGNDLTIFIGGILNDIEGNFQDLQVSNNCPSCASSEEYFSLASYLNSNLFNSWYIAQPNLEHGENCAYDIGEAIDSIYHINDRIHQSSSYNIRLITHSLGGLQTRALLESTASNQNLLNYSIDGTNHYNYNLLSARLNTGNGNATISHVLFLDVPHRGADLASSWIANLITAPAVTDLTPGSNFLSNINNLNNILPLGILYGNLTGYNSYTELSDGAVQFTESTLGLTPIPLINITPIFGGPNNILQMYQQNDSYSLLHIHIHTNNVLGNPGGGIYPSLDCNQTHYNLIKILHFLQNSTLTESSCNTTYIDFLNGNCIASIVSGADIFYKIVGDTSYHFVSKTDETGAINFNILGNISIGDSIMIQTPGKETIVFPIDSSIIQLHSFNVVMFSATSSALNIKYPSLKLVDQKPIVTENTISLEASGQNVLSYEINSPFNQDTAFIPLTLSNSQFTSQLDTGSNLIIVRMLGQVDTVSLSKQVFYFPDTLMSQFTYPVFITADNESLGAKLYVNNQFVKQITSLADTIPVLKGLNIFKFTKFGYTDSLVRIDTTATINISSNLFPNSYSSITDSNIIDFTTQGKIHYWKTVTIMDTGLLSTVSVKEYDDNFPNTGLVPKCRKFEITDLNASSPSISFAAALDQLENLSPDSVYLMRIYDDTGFTKIDFDSAANIAVYDSEVQKLSYNYFTFNNGAVTKEALVIMKRQAPIINNPLLNVNENDSLVIPLFTLFSDPDSIHNDMTFQLTGATPTGISLSISGDSLIVHTNPCYTGTTSFDLQATHDGRTVSNTFNVHVIPVSPGISTPDLTSFCQGGSAVLTATSGTSYQWLRNNSIVADSTGYSFTASTSGSYSVIVFNGICADTSNTIVITVNPLPVVSLANPNSACVNSGVQFLNGVPAGGSYLFDNNIAISYDPSVVSAGPHSAIYSYTDGNGCSNTDTQTITVNPLPPIPTITAGGSTTFCDGGSVALTSSSIGGNTWLPTNEMTDAINAMTNNDYTVTVTDGNNCSATSVATHVAVNPNPTAPIITANGATSFCEGGSVMLTSDYIGGNVWSTTEVADFIVVSTSGDYTVTVTDGNNCSSTSAPTGVVVNPVYNDTVTHNICQGADYDFGGTGYTATGFYPYTFSTVNGCDSMVTLHLIVNPTYNNTDQATICSGMTYTFGGNVYSTPGAYPHTFQSVSGCDSIVTLTLTVNQSLHDTTIASICEGANYTFMDSIYSTTGISTHAFTSVSGCDSDYVLVLQVNPVHNDTFSQSICVGQSFTFDGNNYSSNGVYADTFTSAAGCDSIRTLMLNVIQPYYFDTTVYICQGGSYLFFGNSYSLPDTYTQMFTTATGCDSIYTLTLVVNPTYNIPVVATICDGSSYDFEGEVLSVANVYTHTYQTINGCDSISTLTLSVTPLHNDTTIETVCGTSEVFNGITYTESGTYPQMYTSSVGCDSISLLILTLYPTYDMTISATICSGSSYDLGGDIITDAGSYSHLFLSTNGCDSLVTLNLSLYPISGSDVSATMCSGEVISFGGTNYGSTGVFNHMFTSATGCDSVVTLTLTVNPSYNNTIPVSICQGQSYTFAGNNYSTAGSYSDTAATAMGCDSISTLVLTVNPTYSDTARDTICIGDTFIFNGIVYSTTGIYTDSFITTSGCDSIMVLNLLVGPDSCGASGVLTIAQDNINIYPNPTKDAFTISLESKRDVSIEVVSVDGKIMTDLHNEQWKEKVIDTKGWVPGIYVLHLIDQKGNSVSYRIVKE